MPSQYFATMDGDSVLQEIETRRTAAAQGNSNLEMIWGRNRRSYEQLDGDQGSALGSSGSQGEYLKLSVNESRRLVRDFVSLITKDRLAFQPTAEVADATVLWDSRVASALCDWVVNQHQMESIADRLVESCTLTGEGYVLTLWNPFIGEPYMQGIGGSTVRKGELEVLFVNPDDVFFDSSKPFAESSWACVRRKQNRFDLAALFPDKADELLSAESCSQLGDYCVNEDDVWLNYFWHKGTPAVPQGRQLLYAGNSILLVDDVNPYPDMGIPLTQMCPEGLQEMPGHGFALYSLLLPVQEMLDSSYSTISTNQATFGVQSIAIPDGQDVSVQDVGGLSFIRYRPDPQAASNGMPVPLQLTKTPPEVFNFVQDLRQSLQNLSNISGALRGNPPAGVTSGISIATLSANAIELTQSYRKSYVLAMERAMTLVIRIFHKFASVERTISLTGKNNSFIAQSFKGSDLASVKHVSLRTSNPMALTASGRMTMAQEMLTAGFIKSPTQYLQVIETGNLDTIIEPELQEQTLIQAENEAMARGEAVEVLSLDSHEQHILRHRALLSDPQMRRNQVVAGLVLNHILAHVESAKTTDPYLTSIIQTGQLPPPPPPPPEPAPTPGGLPLAVGT